MQINIKNNSDNILHGTLQEENQKEPLIVVCHGYQSNSKHPAIVSIITGLNENGHSTFTFDFSKGSELNLTQQVDDIESVIEHFSSHKEIVLLAGSFGALTATMAARRIKKVKGLITVNGFFGTDELGSRYRRPYKVFKLLTYISPKHKKIWKAYTEGYKPGDINIPVLAIHSKTDDIVSYRQSEGFVKKVAGPKQLKLLDTADHHLSSDEAIATITSLIDGWLRAFK